MTPKKADLETISSKRSVLVKRKVKQNDPEHGKLVEKELDADENEEKLLMNTSYSTARSLKVIEHSQVRRDEDGDVQRRSVVGSDRDYDSSFRKEKVVMDSFKKQGRFTKVNYKSLAILRGKSVHISEQAVSNVVPTIQQTSQNTTLKRSLKNTKPRDYANEDCNSYIHNLICSDEMKSGEYAMERVAQVASLRLK